MVHICTCSSKPLTYIHTVKHINKALCHGESPEGGGRCKFPLVCGYLFVVIYWIYMTFYYTCLMGFIFICVCVCMVIFVVAHECIWRPEFNLGCSLSWPLIFFFFNKCFHLDFLTVNTMDSIRTLSCRFMVCLCYTHLLVHSQDRKSVGTLSCISQACSSPFHPKLILLIWSLFKNLMWKWISWSLSAGVKQGLFTWKWHIKNVYTPKTILSLS